MSRKPLKFWSVTLGENFKPLPDWREVAAIMAEFTSQWVFQLERGHHAEKFHFQGRMILPEGQMTETMLHIFECRGFDRRDVTFNPESNKSIEQGGLAFYVMKDDTRYFGPWHDPSYKPRKRITYEGRDLKCMENPRPFQKFIMDKISEEPNDRDMYWWYNRSGCAGKSKLMKYLRFTRDDFARVPMGSAIQIKTSCIEKGPHTTYMVDLPRVRGSDERQQELFSALEEVKNGWIESPMYGKAQELIMEPPHIHIFSNDLPNLAFASMDRWIVYMIWDEPCGAQRFRKLTVKEILELQNPKSD